MMDFISDLINTLNTGNGYWNPLILLIILVISFLIIYIIRGFGNKSYKKGTDQTQVFLSGNKEYPKDQMHVKGSNMYWGFTVSLKWFYDFLKKMHNGCINDYILWFVIIMGVLFLIFGVIPE